MLSVHAAVCLMSCVPAAAAVLPSCTVLVSFSIRWVCVGGGGEAGGDFTVVDHVC